jgi:DNA-binding NtrC family response regulator
MILLVEDDRPLRRAFAQALQRRGYRVIEAEDGNEAAELLENWVFNLIITDIVLPKLNGIALANIVRIKWRRIPVVIVSAYLSQDAGNQILDRDAVFIEKPIKTDHLIETVQRLIGNPR